MWTPLLFFILKTRILFCLCQQIWSFHKVFMCNRRRHRNQGHVSTVRITLVLKLLESLNGICEDFQQVIVLSAYPITFHNFR